MNIRPLVIYHDHCTDGFGAAFAAWRRFGDDADYVPASYGGAINAPDWIDLVDGRDMYILDFSYPRPVMELALAYASNVVWLDHHKTAFEMWCGKYERGMKAAQFEHRLDGANPVACHIELDDTRSGALIAWNYFHPGTDIPLAIQHIDDRDRWQFKMAGSKEFHAALASYKPWSFDKWYELLNDEHYNTLLTEGTAIRRAHEQNVQAIVNGARMPVEIKWWDINNTTKNSMSTKGLAATCPPYAASDVGHELANQSGTFGLCWYMSRDGKIRCSLRSNGDYDVSAVAKAFGGGGHKNAAGFETDTTTLLGWLANTQGEA